MWSIPGEALALPGHYAVIEMSMHGPKPKEGVDVDVGYSCRWSLMQGEDALPTWLDPQKATVLAEVREGDKAFVRLRVDDAVYVVHASDGWPHTIAVTSPSGGERVVWRETEPGWTRDEWLQAVDRLFAAKIENADNPFEVVAPFADASAAIGEALAVLGRAHPAVKSDAAKRWIAARVFAVVAWGDPRSLRELRERFGPKGPEKESDEVLRRRKSILRVLVHQATNGLRWPDPEVEAFADALQREVEDLLSGPAAALPR
jgi:hypothetical protein